MALKVEGANEEPKFCYGDASELEYPATVTGVAMDHGYNPFELCVRIRHPRLSEDLHLLCIEDEAFMVPKEQILLYKTERVMKKTKWRIGEVYVHFEFRVGFYLVFEDE
ncbi:hypothetical protein IC582_017687 [Cucumis melo]